MSVHHYGFISNNNNNIKKYMKTEIDLYDCLQFHGDYLFLKNVFVIFEL